MDLYRSMHLHLLGFALVILICPAVSTEDLDIQGIHADLYLKLRNVAFAKSPYSTSGTTHNRFILMSPGTVLNYYDYYPGDAYTANLKAKNFQTARENLVPPSVMEKWFDISDVVVSGDLDGGTTGKSLSVIYETILSQMSVKNFKKLYVDGEAKYNEANKYLTDPVQNPINRTENTTRMFLYSFYQEQYTQRRLKMEEAVYNARKKYSSLEYQLWFQRNYKLLNAKVESAYTKWHVFGKKDLVELYKTYVETTSTNTQLERARDILRSSGVKSLDRTRTIYPVSFEPSNWYEYLLPKEVPPSRDVLISKKSLFQSQRDVLRTILEYNTSNGSNGTNPVVDISMKNTNYSTEKRNNATREALTVRSNCLSKNVEQRKPKQKSAATEDPCEKFKNAVDDVVSTTLQQAQAYSELLTLSFLLKADGWYEYYLRSKIQSIDRKIEKINSQLYDSQDQSVYLGVIADSVLALNQLDTDPSKGGGNNWMQFEFSHISSKQETNKVTTKVTTGLEISAKFNNVTFTASSKPGVEVGVVNDALKRSNVKISGELLRVTIKRPWLQPSLFENPTLYFAQVDDDTGEITYVSPPPSSENELRNYINGVGNHHYLLPEYVTSFLLARNLKVEFSGLEAHSKSVAVQLFNDFKAGVSYEMFSLSVPSQVSFGNNHTTATRTTSGLILTIPGIQLIGYYTQVMPEFPRGQK